MSTAIPTSKACCSIPPVLSEYTPQGSYIPYGGFKSVYVTGPTTSENAIICVYDIFGYWTTTQQGADILASRLKTKVYMPNFFEPENAFSLDHFPPKTDQDKAALGAFFTGPANLTANAPKLKQFAEALKADNIKRIGVYGFCWGAKVAIGIGSDRSLVDAVAMVHPAMLSVDDVKKVEVPIAVYISKDENEEEYNKIVRVISEKPIAEKSHHRIYPNMFHGWAAARANLKDEENKNEFEDLYLRLASFFCNALF